MQTSVPGHRLQQLFEVAAPAALPPDPEITRNHCGVLTYFWPSPCEDLVGLWVNVSEHEIMLSTRLSHTHVDQHEFSVRQGTGDVLERIVKQGIAAALDILGSETVFIKIFNEQGNQDSSSGMSPRHLWNDPKHRADWTKFHGKGWTARAWDWRGEVTDT
jgi:hypothetical protein